MYNLTTDEYRRIEYFTDVQRYDPSDRLLRYPRNVIGIGGFALFFYFSNINIQGFSGGFISGTIGRPHLVSSFISVIFIYNFFMYYVCLNKDIEKHNFAVNSLRSYGVSIAKCIIKRDIGKFVISSGLATRAGDYEPKNFSVYGQDSEKTVQVQFTLDPEITNKHEEEIKRLPGFELSKHSIKFQYEISDQDEKFYSENKRFLRRVVVNEFMDFSFPVYFSVFVLAVIVYESIIAI